MVTILKDNNPAPLDATVSGPVFSEILVNSALGLGYGNDVITWPYGKDVITRPCLNAMGID